MPAGRDGWLVGYGYTFCCADALVAVDINNVPKSASHGIDEAKWKGRPCMSYVLTKLSAPAAQIWFLKIVKQKNSMPFT
jgi:hypothetical protein